MVAGNTLISSEGHFFVIVQSPCRGWISRFRTPLQRSLIRVRCFSVALIRRMSYSSLDPTLKRCVPPRCITFCYGPILRFTVDPSRFTTYIHFVSKEGSVLNATPLSFNSVPQWYLRFIKCQGVIILVTPFFIIYYMPPRVSVKATPFVCHSRLNDVLSMNP